jgi:hypothetical protein
MATKKTGTRIFAVISIILSVLVLLLALTSIVGVWVVHSTAIDVATGVLDGVGQLAQTGQNGLSRLDTRLSNLQEAVGEIESAVDQIAQNVEDKGLVMTLLPPEKEQRLETTAEQISDGLASVKDVLEAVVELKQTVDRLPFVNLPEPDAEKVQTTTENIDTIRSDVADLKANVRQFREESAAEISKISSAAVNVGNRLETSRENLAQIDGRLETLQTAADQLQQRIALYLTIIAVVFTLMFAWVIYAMVVLIQRALAQLQGQQIQD